MPIADHYATDDELTRDSQPQWFAMRATYHREAAVKQLLDMQGIESYLPLRQVIKTVRGRKVRTMAPLISSLLFVYCEKERLKQFKAKVQHLQYMTHPVDGRNVPIIVPKQQMDDFKAVTQCDNDRLVFFKPGELDLKKGAQVRLHGGTFDGVEGKFMKVAGKRNRRVVVEVEDVLAVAVDCTDAQFVEVLDT